MYPAVAERIKVRKNFAVSHSGSFVFCVYPKRPMTKPAIKAKNTFCSSGIAGVPSGVRTFVPMPTAMMINATTTRSAFSLSSILFHT